MFELKPAFDILFQRPDQLTLVTGEMHGETARQVDDKIEEGNEAVMEGVEHLGKYVFEMTKAKVEALKAGGGVLPADSRRLEAEGVASVDEEDEDRIDKVLLKEEVDDEYAAEEPEEVPA